MAKKYVYFFGAGAAEGNMKMKDVLGGKGANLAEMAGIGLPVPPGFTISTEVCALYYKNRERIPESVRLEVEKNLKRLEKTVGTGVRRPEEPAPPLRPLRRPGLHAGDDGHHPQPGAQRPDGRGARREDRQRALRLRLLPPFRPDVRRRRPGRQARHKDDMDPSRPSSRSRSTPGLKIDTDLTAEDLKDLVAGSRPSSRPRRGKDFPEDPRETALGRDRRRLRILENSRAITYRQLNNIPADWGTAVNVQAMVFGNMGDECATGVAFTRDPATGENVFFGEFLPNAQGEDVVAGIRTPQPIAELEGRPRAPTPQLDEDPQALEKHFKDMQDIEFTIEQGKLWMLQTRSGKRTAFAALRIAVEMVEREAHRQEDGHLRASIRILEQLLARSSTRREGRRHQGGPAPRQGPECRSRRRLRPRRLQLRRAELAKKGEKIILVRIETSPEDIHGMNAAEGILTARGGMTSHAALVARGMGKPLRGRLRR